jgi:hypothetical protein
VAAVEIEAMHALAFGLPTGDLAGPGRRRDIVDADAATEIGGHGAAVGAVDLVIDDHQAVRHPHFVGMRTGRHGDLSASSRQFLGSRTSTMDVPCEAHVAM